MKGDVEFVILRRQSWLDASKFESKILGAIVQEFLKPTNNYVPESPLQYNTEDFVEGTVADFALVNSSSTRHNIGTRLKSIAGFSFVGNTEERVHVEGKTVRYKRLQQHEKFWAKLKLDPTVRSTVPTWTSFFNVWPVCLVVGVMVCEDGQMHCDSKNILQRQADVDLPIQALSGTSSMPVSLDNIGSGQTRVSTAATTEKSTKGSFSSGYIFALELKKVTTHFIMRKDLELSKRSPRVDSIRSAGNDIGEEDGDNENIGIEELVLANFSEEEIAEMVG